MSTVSLRRSALGDAELYYRLLDETLRQHITYAWGSFNEDRARPESLEFEHSANGQVIEIDGSPKGILLVRPEPDHLYLSLLCLTPDAQRMGAGTIAMRHVLDAAAAARVPVRLRVIRTNPAKAFYDRLGFWVVEETPRFWIMEYAA